MPNSTRYSFLKDTSYIAISKYTGIAVSLLISAILARILSPQDYGVIALATVFILFFTLFSDMGIGKAIIQFRDLSTCDIADISGFTFWLSLLLGGCFYFAAYPIAKFYNQPILVSVCQLLSLQIMFTTLNVVPSALLYKDKRFATIALRDFIIQVVCGIISIIAAFNGAGIYALLISPIIGTISNYIVNVWTIKLPMHINPSVKPLKKIYSFSIFQFLTSLVGYIGNSLDRLLIGKIISLSDLGYYEKASRVIQLPVQNINGVISPVLYPYLAESQDDLDRMFSIFNRLNQLMVTIAFPLASLLCVCSKEIIMILYGPQWGKAIRCFSILTINLGMVMSTASLGAVIVACGRTKLLFNLGWINTLMALCCLVIGAYIWGTIEAICGMYVFSSTFSSCLSLYLAYRVCFNKSIRRYLLVAFKSLLFYISFVGLGLFIDGYTHLNIVESLCAKVLIWLFLFFMFVRVFTNYDIKHYLTLIINKFLRRSK